MTEKFRRIKITSDGTSHGTKVLDAETGEQIGLVTTIDFHVEAGDTLASARIEVMDVPVELVVTADVVKKHIGS